MGYSGSDGGVHAMELPGPQRSRVRNVILLQNGDFSGVLC
jgi:hypothetical protein